MNDYKVSDMHFPLAALNIGLTSYWALEGDATMIGFNGGLAAMNGGIALSGRKDEIREGLSEAPDKALEGLYDVVVKEGVVERISGREVEPGSRTSGRRIC